MAGSKEAAFRADYEEFEWGGFLEGWVAMVFLGACVKTCGYM